MNRKTKRLNAKIDSRIKEEIARKKRAAMMGCAEKIPGMTGLYFLVEPPDAGLSGPFVGRIIGMENGFYIAQRIIHGVPPHIHLGDIKLFAPGDLYGDHVQVFRTAEELDRAFFDYWGQWAVIKSNTARDIAMRAGLHGEKLGEFMRGRHYEAT